MYSESWLLYILFCETVFMLHSHCSPSLSIPLCGTISDLFILQKVSRLNNNSPVYLVIVVRLTWLSEPSDLHIWSCQNLVFIDQCCSFLSCSSWEKCNMSLDSYALNVTILIFICLTFTDWLVFPFTCTGEMSIWKKKTHILTPPAPEVHEFDMLFPFGAPKSGEQVMTHMRVITCSPLSSVGWNGRGGLNH